MKKFLFFGAVLAGMLASCNQNSKTFILEGTVSEDNADSIYHVFIGNSDYENNTKGAPHDTIVVKDKMIHYSIDIDSPTVMCLRAILGNGKPRWQYDMVIVPGETAKATIRPNKIELDGSKFYQQAGAMRAIIYDTEKRLDELYEQLSETTRDSILNEKKATDAKFYDYLIAHNREEGALIYANRYSESGRLASKLFDTIAAPEMKKGRFAHYIEIALENEREQKEYEAKMAEAMEKTAVGKMFTDFAVEYKGKTQKLSDYVGKGQYVLVDFWASWCGPCRAEIPNLISVYNKYKDKNVNVLGVAVGDKPEDSERAISEMGVNYPQIINAQNTGADEYGINGIPHVILFGPDGTILERWLYGPTIEEAVRKHLGL